MRAKLARNVAGSATRRAIGDRATTITRTKRDGTVFLPSTRRTSPRKLQFFYVTLTRYRMQLRFNPDCSEPAFDQRSGQVISRSSLLRATAFARARRSTRTNGRSRGRRIIISTVVVPLVGFTYMLIACFPRDCLIAGVRTHASTHKVGFHVALRT